MLWNAGRLLTHYLETHCAQIVQDQDVLELGAGVGLPGLVCSAPALGARSVLLTDYPDHDLIDNLTQNVASTRATFASSSSPDSAGGSKTDVRVQGYLWGTATEALRTHLPKGRTGFGLVILADLIFNHSEHAKLVETVKGTLDRDRAGAQALVFFTPHRPWLLEKDLAFFEAARAQGLVVEKVLEEVLEKPMFEVDRGDELLRRTVYGYRIQWPTTTTTADE